MPLAINLWPHQMRGIGGARWWYSRGYREIAIASPTGSGKSAIGAALADGHLKRGGKHVLVDVHRVELVMQLAGAMRAAGLEKVRTITADGVQGPEDAKVTVCSFQKMIASDWRDLSALPEPTFRIVDECHHRAATAPVWLAATKRWPGVPCLGLTATPVPAMGAMFKKLVVAAQPHELVPDILVPVDIFCPTNRRVDANVGTPLQHYQRWSPNGRAIVFCADVVHAEEVAQQFRDAGIPAESIDGKTKKAIRKDVLARFNAGELRVITNVFVLTEGFDSPPADTCIVARGCSSVVMWLQMIGRIRRRFPGKTRAILIDMRGHVHELGTADDVREYTLDAEPKLADNLSALTTCQFCLATYRWQPVCPRCGATAETPPRPKTVSGELTQYKRENSTASPGERSLFAKMELKRAFANGFKGQEAYREASRKFKERYHYPPGDAEFGVRRTKPKGSLETTAARGRQLLALLEKKK